MPLSGYAVPRQTGDVPYAVCIPELCGCSYLFLVTVAVAAHELVHAAGGVNQLLLAGEEGV